MGIAVTSGVLASLDSHSPLQPSFPHQKWESHTPGTSTPVSAADVDPSLPSHFIACVKREESVKKLEKIFGALGSLSSTVEITAGDNLNSIKRSDVILLW